mgnify:CR=1 FL=1
MRRPGFTLIELVVSMTLSLLVLAVAIPFFRVQSAAVEKGAGRMESTQNARFAQNAIDRELRLAGGEVGQPVIVQAAPFALSFNVNLVSHLADDPSAVYIDEDADSLAVMAWRQADAGALPVTGATYPTRDYTDAAGNQSGAETISYWVARDPASARSDLYILWRRVNDGDSTLVARDLVIPADTGWFFRYARVDSSGALSPIAAASLPALWNDTTRLVDSIRVVEVRASSVFRDERTGRDVLQTVYGRTRLLNAGLLQERTCGTAPLPPRNVTATLQTDADGVPTGVRIAWDASLEEAGGERDVALYLVQRRLSTSTAWTTLRNVPANGDAAYAFEDFDLAPGSWIYGVFAQDCSPANSPVVSSSALVIP